MHMSSNAYPMHRRRTEAEVAGGGRRRVDEDPGIHAEAAAATGAACGRTQGRPERDAPGRTTTAPQRPGAGPAVAAAPQWAAALWSRRRRWAWGGLGAALGVLACVLLVQPTEAGKCVKPPKGSTAFCEIGHQVYVSSDTMQNDTEYWCAPLPARLRPATQLGSAGRECWPCCP